ncbi:hypothetical protein C0Q70_01277 [Pomacea canaliculata]|uniref:Uncharacterized protein n=1 Tax=Pomacea canaliculata TaxID=400727 RepID=A0A2T7PZ21_POMCA|nr:uncharacterized protein LOC112556518 [Pomacea canaliculata]PVD38659.1 hypothetical protein C0Q70_01277 [Pomacea canaliculata]
MPTEFKLEKFVKEVLEAEVSRNDCFLEDANQLLVSEGNEDVRSSMFGYPTYPLYRCLSAMLQTWMETKKCPVLALPRYELLDEKGYEETRAAVIASVTPLLTGLESLWQMWTAEEIKFRVREILMLLCKRGILDLLGLRKTVGSKEKFPPSRMRLMESFKEKHSVKSELWVGARALSKHYHRDHSTSWWGNCTGSEEEKNVYALDKVTKILNNATWINIHWLPHDVYILEVRQENGYGARWVADGSSFRGFLEPQMEGGHDVGWRH